MRPPSNQTIVSEPGLSPRLVQVADAMADLLSKDVVGDAAELVGQLGRTPVIPDEMLPRLNAMTRELHEAWTEATRAGAIVDLALPLAPVITDLVGALLEGGGRSDTERRDTVRNALAGVVQAFEYFESRSGLIAGNPTELLNALLSGLHLTHAVLADWLDCAPRTLQHWLRGDSEPEPVALDLIRRLCTIAAQLRHIYSPSGVVEWLNEPMALLGGRTPVVAIRQQEELEVVLRLIWSLRGQ